MTRFRAGVDIGGTFTDVVFLGDDGAVKVVKVASTPDDYSRAVIDGLAQGHRRAGHRPAGHPRAWARLHCRHQRHPRRQGRADGPGHDRRIPGCPGADADTHTAPLRPLLPEAAPPRGATTEAGGEGEGQLRGRGTPAPRRGRCRCRRRDRGLGGHPLRRRLAAPLICEPRPRAPHRRRLQAGAADGQPVCVQRAAARDAGVRADQHHRHQRLRPPRRRGVPAAAGRGAARHGRRRPRHGHAVERRPHTRWRSPPKSPCTASSPAPPRASLGPSTWAVGWTSGI